MIHNELVPGALVIPCRIPISGPNGLNGYTMMHGLRHSLDDTFVYFGLDSDMLCTVLARVPNAVYLMVCSSRHGTRFGWCSALKGFKIVS